MLDPLSILIQAGKIIGGAKAIKNVSDFVTEDREAKRKAAQLQKDISTIQNRTFFEALIMYVMAAFAGVFLISCGIVGFAITVIMFLVHCSSLEKLRHYVDIKREVVLSLILAIVFLFCFI